MKPSKSKAKITKITHRPAFKNNLPQKPKKSNLLEKENQNLKAEVDMLKQTLTKFMAGQQQLNQDLLQAHSQPFTERKKKQPSLSQSESDNLTTVVDIEDTTQLFQGFAAENDGRNSRELVLRESVEEKSPTFKKESFLIKSLKDSSCDIGGDDSGIQAIKVDSEVACDKLSYLFELMRVSPVRTSQIKVPAQEFYSRINENCVTKIGEIKKELTPYQKKESPIKNNHFTIRPKPVESSQAKNTQARHPRRTREARKMGKRNSIGSTDSQQTCCISSVSSQAPIDNQNIKRDTVSNKFTCGTNEILSPGYLKNKLESNIKELQDKSESAKKHNFIMTPRDVRSRTPCSPVTLFEKALCNERARRQFQRSSSKSNRDVVKETIKVTRDQELKKRADLIFKIQAKYTKIEELQAKKTSEKSTQDSIKFMRQNREAFLTTGQVSSTRSRDRTPTQQSQMTTLSPSFSQSKLKTDVNQIQTRLKQTIDKHRLKGRTSSGWGFKTMKNL